jgi:hypothetical protein
MRSPEEQAHFLAHGRFNLPLANDRSLSARVLAIVACGYWALAAVAFFINLFGCFFFYNPVELFSYFSSNAPTSVKYICGIYK